MYKSSCSLTSKKQPNQRMGSRSKELLLQRRHTDGQRAHEKMFSIAHYSVQLLSHVQLCDPMDCSTPSFPVHHQLLEPTLTHVHWVSDAMHPSQPLSSLLLPHQGLFQCSLLEKCKSKLQGSLTSHQSKWPSSKSLQAINAEDGVEEQEPYYTVVGM